MPVSSTSLMAYQEVLENLGSRQQEVYQMLKNLGSANNTILSKKLNWSINRVTPRIKELRNQNLVIQDSIRLCPITKKSTIFWKCNNLPKIKNEKENQNLFDKTKEVYTFGFNDYVVRKSR